MEVVEEQWTTLTAPLTEGGRENSYAFRYDFQKTPPMPPEPHTDLLPSLHDVPEGSEIRDSHSIPVIGQTTRNGGADRLRHGAIALFP